MSKTLVILGGGAAGILIIMKLANTKGLDIVLIDHKSFYEYTPGLCSVLYEKSNSQFENHFKKITFDYREFASKHHIKFIHGNVQSVNKDDTVSLVNEQEKIKFDYLVICTGSSYDEPWRVPGNPTIDYPTRLEGLRQHREKYKNAENILCIGGGPVGTELATEIANRAPSKHVTLVDRSETVLSSSPGNLGRIAQDIIQNNYSQQIRLINKDSCSRRSETVYETDESHQTIQADLVYNCIGVKPNSGFMDESDLDDKKQIRVDEYLCVRDNKIFALGDVNSIKEPKMFYTAHMQAVHFTQHFERIWSNRSDFKPYRGVRINMVVSMGPSHAIGSVSGINLTGFISKKGSHAAAVMKYLIEKISMNEFNSKVLFNEILYYTQQQQ